MVKKTDSKEVAERFARAMNTMLMNRYPEFGKAVERAGRGKDLERLKRSE